MYGVLTGDRDLAREGLGEFTHAFTDFADGSRSDPVTGTTAVVACWGDTETVRRAPDRAAVDAEGTRATPDAEGHHWGTVCPTDPDYRNRLLDRISTVGATGDVRLTTAGFPGESFCRCDRCDERFEESEHETRAAWREAHLTAFVEAAAERVSGDLSVTLYPDPYPGSLRSRTGLTPEALSPHVESFLVPLCGDYETPYWVESLARGFATRLADLDATVTIQLSAAGTDVDRLVDVTRMVDPHCDAVCFGAFPEDADTVRATIDALVDRDEPVQSV
ncbi:hypothetical protein [Halovivax gelatinilyticus]|uniref:hypothetical protein n=1 Tax=Halovivax gelatinilyticus TaxID=2961597 RepID=UPI0020CA8D47|nr:hypothetical protein [Halovivax gelatinilyticus]